MAWYQGWVKSKTVSNHKFMQRKQIKAVFFSVDKIVFPKHGLRLTIIIQRVIANKQQLKKR